MESLPLMDRVGRPGSPATRSSFHQGLPPRNKGLRYAPDPPTVEEIIAVMRAAGDGECEPTVAYRDRAMRAGPVVAAQREGRARALGRPTAGCQQDRAEQFRGQPVLADDPAGETGRPNSALRSDRPLRSGWSCRALWSARSSGAGRSRGSLWSGRAGRARGAWWLHDSVACESDLRRAVGVVVGGDLERRATWPSACDAK